MDAYTYIKHEVLMSFIYSGTGLMMISMLLLLSISFDDPDYFQSVPLDFTELPKFGRVHVLLRETTSRL